LSVDQITEHPGAVADGTSLTDQTPDHAVVADPGLVADGCPVCGDHVIAYCRAAADQGVGVENSAFTNQRFLSDNAEWPDIAMSADGSGTVKPFPLPTTFTSRVRHAAAEPCSASVSTQWAKI